MNNSLKQGIVTIPFCYPEELNFQVMADPINLIPGKRYTLCLKDGQVVKSMAYVNADLQRGKFRFRCADGETREYPINNIQRIVFA